MKYILLAIFSTLLIAGPKATQKFNWNGVDVVWLEEDKFPTYSVFIYYSDGALADGAMAGETNAMFKLLTNGTSKNTQEQLAEKLDFLGSGFGANITHEYTTLSYHGLVKDAPEVTNLLCEVLTDATYPESELNTFKKKRISGLNNLVANHGNLANRMFRKISLGETPFGSFVSGSKSTINKFSTKGLIEKRKYFNDKVYKKIFITGPKKTLKIGSIFKEKCNWSGKAKFNRASEVKHTVAALKTNAKPKLYFAAVKGANQAQIRMGNALPIDLFSQNKFDLTKLMTTILGGSFTSMLMQELRVKKGLTYGVYSYAAPQAKYARSVLTTSTKNETVVDALNSIKTTLSQMTDAKFEKTRFDSTKKFLKGKHLLKFESNSSYISNLILFDHIQKNYRDLYNFSNIIDTFKYEDVVNQGKDIFAWNKQMVFILGDSSVLSKIKAMGEYDIKEVKVENFL